MTQLARATRRVDEVASGGFDGRRAFGKVARVFFEVATLSDEVAGVFGKVARVFFELAILCHALASAVHPGARSGRSRGNSRGSRRINAIARTSKIHRRSSSRHPMALDEPEGPPIGAAVFAAMERTTKKPRRSGAFCWNRMVERRGIEPLTFAMRTRRSPS